MDIVLKMKTALSKLDFFCFVAAVFYKEQTNLFKVEFLIMNSLKIHFIISIHSISCDVYIVFATSKKRILGVKYCSSG